MLVKHIHSSTYHGQDPPANNGGVLVISPDGTRGGIVAYAEDAQAAYDFLKTQFCGMTMSELYKLMRAHHAPAEDRHLQEVLGAAEALLSEMHKYRVTAGSVPDSGITDRARDLTARVRKLHPKFDPRPPAPEKLQDVVLEDTGERRYPKQDEYYRFLPQGSRRLYLRTEDDGGGWCGQPHEYAILRVKGGVTNART